MKGKTFPFAGLYINSRSELSLLLCGELKQALTRFTASCEKAFPSVTESPIVYFGIQDSLNGIRLCINENASENGLIIAVRLSESFREMKKLELLCMQADCLLMLVFIQLPLPLKIPFLRPFSKYLQIKNQPSERDG